MSENSLENISEPPAAPQKSSILASAALLLASILVSFFALEAAVRIMGSRLSAPTRNDRPTLYFFSDASGSTRNDKKYTQGALADGYRIVIVGDSFTFGYDNLSDDAFPQRLGRILNLNAGQPPVEVINWGRPGNSIRTNARDAKWAEENLQPDLLILEITLNDPEVKPFDENNHKVSLHGDSVVQKYPLLNHWKTLGFVLQRIENNRSYERYKRYFQHLYTDPETKNNFLTGLSEMQTVVEGTKTKLVAVVFPLLTFPLDETYPFADAHKFIDAELDRRGITHLDLFDAFKGMQPDRLQAIPADDPHPNEIAHRIAAEAIYKWLVKEHLIPATAVVKLTDTKRLVVTHIHKRGDRRPIGANPPQKS